MSPTGPVRIGVALKWQSLRPEIDPLSGVVTLDERFMGASESDRAALEWGLRLAEEWGGEVLAACAGPPAAEPMLRMALAVGAAHAIRCELPDGASSVEAATSLALVFHDVDVALCGDYSLDRGSGSVPALLAAELDAAQALGLIRLQAEEQGVVRAHRRLDGGRRERVRVRAPAVLSVEGGTARLRRASLSSALAAGRTEVPRCDPPTPAGDGHAHVLRPFRPRARALEPPDPSLPARERIRQLTGALSERGTRQVVRVEPADGAEQLIDALRNWGYLE
ncbi:MAG: mycofactocin-associated electron transfer flavoprotein beta subunit [Nocardioidaceae bacterium]